MAKESGMVRSVNMPQKTFGFIATTDGDRFFHWSDYDLTSDKPFHHLKTGDVVTFDADVRDDKPVAKSVHFKYKVDTRKKK